MGFTIQESTLSYKKNTWKKQKLKNKFTHIKQTNKYIFITSSPYHYVLNKPFIMILLTQIWVLITNLVKPWKVNSWRLYTLKVARHKPQHLKYFIITHLNINIMLIIIQNKWSNVVRVKTWPSGATDAD